SSLRGKDHAERRVFQFEPGDTALVVVVAEESFGAQAKEAGEGLVRAERSGLAQSRRCPRKPRPVLNMIGDRNQLCALALDDRVGTVDLRFLVRMLGDVGFDFLPRDANRAQGASWRKRSAADKRLVVLQQIIASTVDHQ